MNPVVSLLFHSTLASSVLALEKSSNPNPRNPIRNPQFHPWEAEASASTSSSTTRNTNPNTPPPTSHSDPPPELSLQIQRSHDLHHVFATFDSDSDSRLSLLELVSLLRSLGNSRPSEEAAEMMSAGDLDGDGYIGVDEFLKVNRMEKDKGKCVEDLREAFGVYDNVGDGRITAGELWEVMRGVVGENGTGMEECRAMIRAVGEGSGDGSAVGFEDFVGLMTGSIRTT